RPSPSCTRPPAAAGRRLSTGTAGKTSASLHACAWSCRVAGEFDRTELVAASALAVVGFRRGGADQVAVGVECLENTRFILARSGLQFPQRVLGDEKRALHRAVVSPEADRAPRRV